MVFVKADHFSSLTSLLGTQALNESATQNSDHKNKDKDKDKECHLEFRIRSIPNQVVKIVGDGQVLGDWKLDKGLQLLSKEAPTLSDQHPTSAQFVFFLY